MSNHLSLADIEPKEIHTLPDSHIIFVFVELNHVPKLIHGCLQCDQYVQMGYKNSLYIQP